MDFYIFLDYDDSRDYVWAAGANFIQLSFQVHHFLSKNPASDLFLLFSRRALHCKKKIYMDGNFLPFISTSSKESVKCNIYYESYIFYCGGITRKLRFCNQTYGKFLSTLIFITCECDISHLTLVRVLRDSFRKRKFEMLNAWQWWEWWWRSTSVPNTIKLFGSHICMYVHSVLQMHHIVPVSYLTPFFSFFIINAAYIIICTLFSISLPSLFSA